MSKPVADTDTPVDDATDANVHDTSETSGIDAAPVTDAVTVTAAGPVDDTVKGSSVEKETLDKIIDNDNNDDDGDDNDEGYNTCPESESPDIKKKETESLSALSTMKENRLYYPHCARCRKAKSEYPIICDGKRPCNECTRKYLKRNKLSSMEGLSLDTVPCVYKEQKYLNGRKITPAEAKKMSSIVATTANVATEASIKPLDEEVEHDSSESESNNGSNYYRPRMCLETMDNVKVAVLVDTLRFFHVLTHNEDLKETIRRLKDLRQQQISSFWSKVLKQYEDPKYGNTPHTDAATCIHGVFEHPISLARGKLSDQASSFNSKQLMVIYDTNIGALMTAMEGFETSHEKNKSDLSGDISANMKVKQRYRRQQYAEDHADLHLDPHILYIWYLLEESDMMDLVGRTRKYPASVLPKLKKKKETSVILSLSDETRHQAATLFYSTLAQKVSLFEAMLENKKTEEQQSKIKERLDFMEVHLDLAWKRLQVQHVGSKKRPRGKKRSRGSSPNKKK